MLHRAIYKSPKIASTILGLLAFIAMITKKRYSPSPSLDFWKATVQAGNQSLYLVFTKLKFRNLDKKGSDLTGGFIPKKDIDKIGLQIGVKQLRTHISRLKKKGLLIPTFKGYYMKSMKDAAKELGVELTQLTIKAKTLPLLKLKLAYITTTRCLKRQQYVTDKTMKQNPVTFSCQTFSDMLGYKSATTGCNREKLLENEFKVLIGRSKNRQWRVTHKGVLVFWRPCNRITLAPKKMEFQLYCQKKALEYFNKTYKVCYYTGKDGKKHSYTKLNVL